MTNDHDQKVHPEDWNMIERCISFLHDRNDEIAALNSSVVEKEAESWMLYCSLNIPHPPFDTNATWLGSVHEHLLRTSIPVWPDEVAFHPADSYMSISKNVWGNNYTDDQILKVRATYFAMVAETDYMLGLVMSALSETLRESTYIVFLSDHGEMAMEHRQVWKNSMYEASSRVPMVVSGPGIAAGKVVESLTSLLDVFPTLLSLAGVPLQDMPSYLDGHSLMPLMSTTATTGPTTGIVGYPANRSVVSQYHSNMGNTGSFMLRSGKYKYIAFGHGLPEIFAPSKYTAQLFDVIADPNEMHDLAATAPPALLASLDAELRAVVDYETVDKAVKVNDQGLYRQYFRDASGGYNKKLRKQFESAYTGFDDEDWAKVKRWDQMEP
jgi:arylsulfatase K